ncbi:ATPase [Lachnospiraceae bacterium NE2001]|nr:ATPase [Lachnospiraceae bacterium NE2001]
MIGRKDEVSMLNDSLYSGRPEFVAIYGRRRVGKTYLVKDFLFHKYY